MRASTYLITAALRSRRRLQSPRSDQGTGQSSADRRSNWTRVSDEARQSIQSALDRLRQHPGDPLLNGEAGMALHANRRYQEAAVLYDRARKIHPDVFRWEYYRGLVLSELNDVDEAAAPFPAGARDQQKTTRAPNWRWRAALLQERAHDG
ncbi:MAG: tetratricopeptide repeat protein [Bryobacterales bacterium]